MKAGRSTGALLLFILGGALVGTILAQVLSGVVPVLKAHADAGLNPPTTLDLVVLRVTFGFLIHLTLGTAVGIGLGLLAYRRF